MNDIVKDLIKLKKDIRDNAIDTVWVGEAETAWDRIARLIEKYKNMEDLKWKKMSIYKNQF